MKRIHIMTALAVIAIFWSKDNSVIGQQAQATLVVQFMQTVTKGFPCILKLEIGGPALSPISSLYDDLASIRVELVSKTNNVKYSIVSSKGRNTTYMTPEGEELDGLSELEWQVPVSAGTRRSILLDLSSLRPEKSFPGWTVLADVPPGEYEVKVSIPEVNAQAATFRMNIIAPTQDEQQFLSDMKKDNLGLRNEIAWNRVLGSDTPFPRATWDRLSQRTKDQTAFHRLLADLNVSNTSFGTNDLSTIATTPLPKFIEPERDCLLYEVTIATGKNDEAEASKLMKQYPDLEWRLQDIKTDKKSFLRNKKAAANKDKPASN